MQIKINTKQATTCDKFEDIPMKTTLIYHIWMSFNVPFICTVKVYFTLVYSNTGGNWIHFNKIL